MDLNIKGKKAFITGGSKGIGRACAIALVNEGVDVAICARGEEQLQKTKYEIEAVGVEVHAFTADLARAEDATTAFSRAENALGRVDILVNNVGGSLGTTDIENTTTEDFTRVMEVNFVSSLRLMKEAIPAMKERRWGRVINISSIYGREYGGSNAYMAAKAAVIATGKHAAISLASYGVTVNSIAPGSILFKGGSWDRFISRNSPDTVEEFIKRNLPMGKFGWPEAIGAMCAFLASEQAGLITGVSYNVDGGQSHSLI